MIVFLWGAPREDQEDQNEVEYPSRFFDAGKPKPRKHVIPVACSGYLRAWRKKRDECSTT